MRLVEWWNEVRDRHDRFMDDDPQYALALAAGAAAVIQVTITHTPTAKAITILITHLLDANDTTSRSERDHWHDDAPRTASRPVWGRSEWMDN